MHVRHNKVSFFWVLIVFIIAFSMAYATDGYAKSVEQYNLEQESKELQQDLDFPVLDHWPAGNYEDAVWVDPRQNLSPVGLSEVEFDTPKYKMNLDSGAPHTMATDYDRIDKGVAKIELFSWD